MKEAEERAEGLANGVAAMNARFLEILGGQVGQHHARHATRTAWRSDPARRARSAIPRCANLRRSATRHSDIRTEEQARLDEQFSLIFDDMLISILTAQKTVGDAFAGLAIGIVDTFAIEFTKASARILHHACHSRPD